MRHVQLTHASKHAFARNFAVIDDFAPPSLHSKLLSEVTRLTYALAEQARPKHYQHVFKADVRTLPRADESYLARFHAATGGRSAAIDEFHDLAIRTMREVSPASDRFLRPVPYRLEPGDFFRSHVDDYAGQVGYTYFLNNGWCWDWGGILTMVFDTSRAEPIYPVSNRLVLRNETIKLHHFLDPVAPWAKHPQYLFVAWGGDGGAGDSKMRGKYEPVTEEA